MERVATGGVSRVLQSTCAERMPQNGLRGSSRAQVNFRRHIALHVESSEMERPFCYRGRPYMRFQNVTTVMPQDKYRQLLMERGGNYSWEAMTNPDLKISDLDEHAILGAVRGGIRCGRLPEATK